MNKGFASTKLASFSSPFNPLFLLVFFFIALAFFLIAVWFMSPGLLRAPTSSKLDTYTKFVNQYINVNGWESKTFRNFISYTDHEKWNVYLSYFDQKYVENNLEMVLSSGTALRESFPKKGEFYSNEVFKPPALEKYLRKRGVVDENLFKSILSPDVQNNIKITYNYQEPIINGNWNFTPSKQNNGLKEIILEIEPTVLDSVFLDLKWIYDPNYIPNDIKSLQDTSDSSIYSRIISIPIFILLMLLTTLYYFSLNSGIAALGLQLLIIVVEFLAFIFIFKVAFKNVMNSRLRILWLMLGIFSLLILYTAMMLILTQIYTPPN